MSSLPSLEFDIKYMDYVSECPMCNNKDIELICPSSSLLSNMQLCKKCRWNQKVYHKYYDELEK